MRFHCIECKLLTYSLTGKGNLSNVAMYKQWNNLTHISGWREVNGTDGGDILGGEGVLFNPQISRDQKLYAFISQLFRYVYMGDTAPSMYFIAHCCYSGTCLRQPPVGQF